MLESDAKAFGLLLQDVAAMYGRDLSPGVVGLYFRALREYDLGAVRAAFDRHVRNPDAGQYFPKPADLIRMLGGGTEDSALAAWAAVEMAIARIGGHVSVAFEDAVTMRVLADMGGWVRLCDMTAAQLEHQQREFVSRYRGFVMRSEIPDCPGRLPGRIEAANGERFAEFNPPVAFIAKDGRATSKLAPFRWPAQIKGAA